LKTKNLKGKTYILKNNKTIEKFSYIVLWDKEMAFPKSFAILM
jgi:hypothetical protein